MSRSLSHNITQCTCSSNKIFHHVFVIARHVLYLPIKGKKSINACLCLQSLCNHKSSIQG